MCSCLKSLGLFTASDLSWNQHVNRITAKANRVLGLDLQGLNDVDTMAENTLL